MPLSLRRALLIALICVATFSLIQLNDVLAQARRPARAGATRPPAVAVPTPREVIGFTPGDDRKLASWSQIVDYFKRLEQTTRRLIFNDLGKTTLGRPFVVALISSPANLANINRIQEIQRKLADPRLIGSRDTEAEKLIAEGRTVVLITCGIHSTEVGGPLAAMNIAYKLVSDDSAETREILDKCIVLLVPSLNPDGVDIVKNWYDKTLGTPAEGTSPPELYHHYTGHDNNRDWYAFTQVETQMTVDRIQNVWRPQIVHDIHQQGETGSRFFIPPYVEPWEPNVPPLIQAGVNFMGSAMAWEMASEGKAGVVINGVYDAWTPARAYQHYHGGIRILSETASCRIATPTRVPFERLSPQIGVDPKVRSWNFPDVWPGGEWKLANIVDYMQSGAFALMRNAARYRERWLRDFYRIGKDAVAEQKAGEPFAFLIPPVAIEDFWRFEGYARLLEILKRGDVKMTEVDEPFEADGKKYPAGTTLILMRQPYGAFAKTLLERQHYPDLREYPGGPPRRPYDVTAHTLPLLMGVNVAQVNHPFRVPTEPKTSGGIGAQRPVNNAAPRVGLYKSYVASMDEGWTRWMFDQLKSRIDWFKFSYQSLLDEEVRAGNLRAKYDCIILPAQSAASIVNGLPKDRYPADVAGGITAAGVEALKQFVEEGGTLITLNEASQFAIDYLNAPVRNVLAGVAAKDFYCPGSILKIKLDTNDPLAKNAPMLESTKDESVAWFEFSPAFETTSSAARIIARFADANELLLSGWLLGAEKIAGKGAIVEVKRGKGRIVMFGFRPQYRGQSIATLPFLFNAVETSVPASLRPRVVSMR
ncbi:MAG: M14 metallopeptidase family protein [Blastocatellia bacterium]